MFVQEVTILLQSNLIQPASEFHVPSRLLKFLLVVSHPLRVVFVSRQVQLHQGTEERAWGLPTRANGLVYLTCRSARARSSSNSKFQPVVKSIAEPCTRAYLAQTRTISQVRKMSVTSTPMSTLANTFMSSFSLLLLMMHWLLILSGAIRESSDVDIGFPDLMSLIVYLTSDSNALCSSRDLFWGVFLGGLITCSCTSIGFVLGSSLITVLDQRFIVLHVIAFCRRRIAFCCGTPRTLCSFSISPHRLYSVQAIEWV